tara:strand:+ start:1602 stop:1748 length:147 start_codon:yes stop_codon:yes gene_type:complete
MKIRPQIFAGMTLLGLVALYALSLGNVEVATGCVAGLTALCMKLLEGE